jgi:hypothetical protein
METVHENWEQWVEDFAVMDEAELDDESDEPEFDYGLGETDDGEMDAEFLDPVTLGIGALAARKLGRRRKKVQRAQPQRPYAQMVQGKGTGLVKTPKGTAQIVLPGKFPTVEEFRKTVNALQLDDRKNSTGIKQLSEQQRKDAARLAVMVAQTEKKISKQLRNTQIAAIIAATIPLIARVAERHGAALP